MQPTEESGRDVASILIVLLTCQRQALIQLHLPRYVQYVAAHPEFKLVVAIDGYEPALMSILDRYCISYLYGDERRGVGGSKNRVIQLLPAFQYYLFIEDDVELRRGDVFGKILGSMREHSCHHVCVGRSDKFRMEVPLSELYSQSGLRGFQYGSGAVTVYTKHALEVVGGWHESFYRHRRFGHTEHSHRACKNALCPAPFVYSEEWSSAFSWHEPPSVTRIRDVHILDYAFRHNQIIEEEQRLIDESVGFFAPSQDNSAKLVWHERSKVPKLWLLSGSSLREILNLAAISIGQMQHNLFKRVRWVRAGVTKFILERLTEVG